MKITVRELKQLIKEAAFEGPSTASLSARPHKLSPSGYNKRLKISRLEFGKRSPERGWLEIYFLRAPRDFFDQVGDVVEKTELADVLLTLGFSEEAAADVDHADSAPTGDGGIHLEVGSIFCVEWISLFGAERIVDLR